jgi:hypothetical protein
MFRLDVAAIFFLILLPPLIMFRLGVGAIFLLQYFLLQQLYTRNTLRSMPSAPTPPIPCQRPHDTLLPSFPLLQRLRFIPKKKPLLTPHLRTTPSCYVIGHRRKTLSQPRKFARRHIGPTIPGSLPLFNLTNLQALME